MEFENARLSVVKSIKPRDLTNVWLRLYARAQATPSLEQFEPKGLGDETPDLVFYTVDAAVMPPHLAIRSDRTRMSSAYGYGRISSGDVSEFV